MDEIHAASPVCLMIFGGALLLAIRLVYGVHPDRSGSVELLLKMIAATAIAAGWLGLLLLMAGMAGLVLFVASLVVAQMTLAQIHVFRQRALVDLLALAMEKRIPLTAVVRAYAADQPPAARGRLDRLGADLAAGMSLGQALARTRSLVPRQALLAATVGERTGGTESALRQAAGAYAFGLPLHQALVGRIFYLAWMAFLIPAICAFVARKILPAFVAIFEDFELELPTMTVLLWNVLRLGVTQLVGGLAPLAGLAVLAYTLGCYDGILPLPTFGLGRWLERGNILRALALAVESGHPLGESLQLLADGYPQRSVARRLRAVAADVAAGGDWAESLVKHKLAGAGAAAAMQAAQRAGNLPWALRQLAETSERRLSYRLEAALNIVSPLVVLGLAALVMLFVVGCFMPLVKLIQSLT